MTSKQKIPRVPETINFAQEEEKILKFWKDIDAFKTCLKQSKGKQRYSFFDGPPFATGLPHYGHILAGTIKDVVTRYAHQQGYHVDRRFGWDCHGLPVEYEIDKSLKIKGPEDVEKMGINKYNAECFKIVTRYANEWEEIISRIGRWIDFENDYKTMYPWYMESIWWVFKQLYNKGLVYQGNKVMPYSTGCMTPLSNFESGLNYKEVSDPAITVALPLIDKDLDASLLIWTTTPWTLPSNMAACVNPNFEYILFKHLIFQRCYIMLENRLEEIFRFEDIKIIKKIKGTELIGKKYEPPFPYYKNLKNAFIVVGDDYVTADSGTGIVHQAPYFGEDDYRVCLANGIITKDQEPICPLDANGRFIKPVIDFEKMYVKSADHFIIGALRSVDKLIYCTTIKHSYPYCWRSDTPLLYRSVPSWFIRVEGMQDKLLKAASETYWVPEFVKDKRFGNWLRDARDWAISRNRYWGTPIPIWMSLNGDEIVCIGSILELEQLTGKKIIDLHRENIDHLEIPSKIPGNPPLKRISEVFDCWFESGSMPYAQQHYPFENFKEFDELFPADFIAEGIDQTRGWFYTLIVISTALFGKAPFKNLIANGLILAGDGQKMSKRKKNYPDPLEIVNKYGADALRLYLINSPVVRAENLRFKEDGVRDILKDVFLPWYNAFRFLMQSIESFIQNNNNIEFVYDDICNIDITNIMDRWILSFTQSLLLYTRKEMELYHLYNVVPRLAKYIDYLTNWYVRMNRKRLKGEGGFIDCKIALTTLFHVLYNIVRMMAPFVPFLTENMYQYLKKLTKSSNIDSVHYLMFPKPNEKLIITDIERAVSRMQNIIELGRVIRDRKTIPMKYPLPEIIVVHQDQQYINDIISLKEYILSELNIKKLTTTTDKSRFGITLRAEPDFKILGSKLKSELKLVTKSIQSLSDNEINDMIKCGYKIIEGQHIKIDEIRLIFKSEGLNTDKYEVNSDNDVLVLLDITPDSSMVDEGLAREIINRVQKLRKKAHLVPTDDISVFYKTDGDLNRVANQYKLFIENTLKATFETTNKKTVNDQPIIEEKQKLKESNLYLVLTRKIDVDVPLCKWANIQLIDIQSHYCNDSTKGLILLEILNKPIGLDNLKIEIRNLFGINKFKLYTNGYVELNEHLLPKLPSGTTIFVVSHEARKPKLPETNSVPFCKVLNFINDNIKGTIILENPVGNPIVGDPDAAIKQWIQLSKK